MEHSLDQVSRNGLPEGGYNNSLADFDSEMCSLVDASEGLIFLIETFAGKRNYYYYTLSGFNIAPLIERAKNKFKVNLEYRCKDDQAWGFIKQYPVQLFVK